MVDKLDTDRFSTHPGRFRDLSTRMRAMRDMHRSEPGAYNGYVRALERELTDMKLTFDREYLAMKEHYDSAIIERESFQSEARKLTDELKDTMERLREESEERKKADEVITQCHEMLNDKDTIIQDLRQMITEQEHSLAAAGKEREQLNNSLSASSLQLEHEIRLRVDCEAALAKANEQIAIERDIHKKDLFDRSNQLVAAERALSLADNKIDELGVQDENLKQQLVLFKKQMQEEFTLYREKTESNYRAQVQEHNMNLEKERQCLAQQREENIVLKSTVDEILMRSKKFEATHDALQSQVRNLLHVLQSERRNAANSHQNLEKRLKNLQEVLRKKVRELDLSHSATFNIDLEIEALTSILEAETARLRVAIENHPSELSLNARAEPVNSYAGLPYLANGRLLRNYKKPFDTQSELTPRTSYAQSKVPYLPPLTDRSTRSR